MIEAPRLSRLSRPASAGRPLPAARLSLASSGLFLLLLLALHVLRPDLDPSWNVISAYALGDHGWLMTAAFASLGVACGALVAAGWPETRSRIARAGLALLLVAALGFVLAAAFPADPIASGADQATTRGHLHGAGAALGGLVPIAAVLVAWGLGRDPAWSALRSPLWLATGVAWLGELSFIVAMVVAVPPDGRLGPGVAIGWPNRFMIVAYCAWLAVAARCLDRPRRERTP